jgi:4-hydroxy-2-oxoheptanedioate aldolase
MVKIVQLEEQLEASLKKLKQKYDLCAVKAEFEAEGASFRDLVRLRRLTAHQDIALHLKIGGVEAIRDIKDAIDLGVDGLIAPMVESAFAVTKFTRAVDSIFSGRNIYKSINIETRTAVLHIDEILTAAKGKIDNITIGRTDLSHSYFDGEVEPDCEFILDLIDAISYKARVAGLALTIGGSIKTKSISRLRENQKKLKEYISSIETRKIILPVESFLDKEHALEEALRFEELYLRAKLETEQLLSQFDRDRLAKLKSRI